MRCEKIDGGGGPPSRCIALQEVRAILQRRYPVLPGVTPNTLALPMFEQNVLLQ